MMTGRFTRILPAACLAVLCGGCATSPARFYTLQSTARTAAAEAPRVAVLVGPVSIPAVVDRPEFVVQTSPNQVSVDEFNRWAGPLGDGVARTVAGDLSVLLGTPRVATAPLANFEDTHRVSIDVLRFDSIAGQGVLVEAVWVVRRTSGTERRSGRTVAHESLQGEGFDAIAAAHGRALGQVSADIAAAIRADVDRAR